jgi:hypothetical protein
MHGSDRNDMYYKGYSTFFLTYTCLFFFSYHSECSSRYVFQFLLSRSIIAFADILSNL